MTTSGNPRLWSLLCLLALLMCLRGHGQPIGVLQRAEAILAPGASYVDLTFTGLVGVASASPISMHSLGEDGEVFDLRAEPAQALGGRPRMLRVSFSGKPPAGHSKIRLCLGAVEVAGTSYMDVCAEARILRDFDGELTSLKASLGVLPRLQREKSMFASLFLGQTGSRAGRQAHDASTSGVHTAAIVGAADVSFVRSDLGSKDLTYFLRLKRGSTSGMDPRNLEAGASWRRSVLMHRRERSRLAAMLAAPADSPRVSPQALREAAALTAGLQRKWFAGHIVEAGVKLEGDAAGEKQWLGLLDAGWSLQSTTRRVSLPGAPGWFRFRWMAGGVEAGREQARVKAGADASLLVQASGSTAPIRRLEFHAQTVGRWLIRAERKERGVRPWLQLDAKAFFFESPRIRYGVRLSVQRGRLPPVYLAVHSIQFGFVVESTGGDE